MDIFEASFKVSTSSRNQMIDITSQVASAVREFNVRVGDVIIHCPHTTAAITINENADPDVTHDILLFLNELIPQGHRGFRHCEGNSDSHLKSSLVGCSQQVIISNGSLKLGTWQGIYFCEFDGPRSRNVILQIRGK
jgi:secondary thiamine-phosphate synthase enzyme